MPAPQVAWHRTGGTQAAAPTSCSPSKIAERIPPPEPGGIALTPPSSKHRLPANYNILAVESTTFDLRVNLNPAKALGLSIPQSILFRAEQVIP